MNILINYAVVLIILGLAGDNLLVANLSANHHAKIPPWHWIFIIISMLVGQMIAMTIGIYIGKMIFPITNKQSQILGIGLLTSLTIKVGREMFEVSRQRGYIISYKLENILLLWLGIGVFQVVMGMAITWLGVNTAPYAIFSTSVILHFILLGYFIGKCHLIKYINRFRSFCTFLMLTGTGLLIYQIF